MKIYVILSTYNGIKYLNEQISSILNQETSFSYELNLLIRDDGSTDDTIIFLNSLLEKVNKTSFSFEIIEGKNIGAKRSFFALMDELKNREFDIAFLSDQDDYWYSDKIENIVRVFDGNLVSPSLYCSRLEVVNSSLQRIGSFIHPSLGYINGPLLTNFVTGCTVAFNKTFIDIYKSPDRPEFIKMHDWWLAYIAFYFDTRIIYDHKCYIKYRQHEHNVVGAPTFLKLVKKIFTVFSRVDSHSRLLQATEFISTYKIASSSNDNINLINKFIKTDNFINRLIFVYSYFRKSNLKTYLTFMVESSVKNK